MSDTATELSVHDKFEALEQILNAELVERRAEIYGVLLAIASRSTFFMLGKPGIAKSYLIDRLMAYIEDVKYFNILMSKTSQPEELFGPISLKALEDDRFEHSIEGYLPTAQAAMVDEIFKCNSSVLNALLWLINEHKYRHGVEVIKAPLSFMACASNELPADDSLNALYDRLLFRYEVDSVKDQRSFVTMMQTIVPEFPDPILSWADIELAQKETDQVVITERVINALADLRRKLEGEKIELSDRRYVQSLKIIRAAAWMDGCDIADTDHLAPLEHVLWAVPEQRGTVSRIVLELANPLEVEASELLASIRELDSQIDDIKNDDERMRLGNEVHAKLNRAADDLKDLQERAGNGKRRSMKVAEVKDKLALVTDRTLVEVFRFSEDDAKSVELKKKAKG